MFADTVKISKGLLQKKIKNVMFVKVLQKILEIFGLAEVLVFPIHFFNPTPKSQAFPSPPERSRPGGISFHPVDPHTQTPHLCTGPRTNALGKLCARSSFFSSSKMLLVPRTP